MKIPFPVKESVIARTSVRNYRDQVISAEEQQALEAFISDLDNPFARQVSFHFLDQTDVQGRETLGTYGVIPLFEDHADIVFVELLVVNHGHDAGPQPVGEMDLRPVIIGVIPYVIEGFNRFILRFQPRPEPPQRMDVIGCEHGFVPYVITIQRRIILAAAHDVCKLFFDQILHLWMVIIEVSVRHTLPVDGAIGFDTVVVIFHDKIRRIFQRGQLPGQLHDDFHTDLIRICQDLMTGIEWIIAVRPIFPPVHSRPDDHEIQTDCLHAAHLRFDVIHAVLPLYFQHRAKRIGCHTSTLLSVVSGDPHLKRPRSSALCDSVDHLHIGFFRDHRGFKPIDGHFGKTVLFPIFNSGLNKGLNQRSGDSVRFRCVQ